MMSSQQQSFSRACYQIAYFQDKPRESRFFSLGDDMNAVGAHKALS